ncbi:MAG: ATP-binding cassette domain-containing protein [Beduini sp.]
MINITHLNIKFDRPIINDSHLKIEEGKITAISGASGCGKTSILYQVGLLDFNYEKVEYYFNGTKINLKSPKELAYYRQYKIGYVFQSNHLLTHLNIKENFENNAGLINQTIDEQRIQEIMQLVGLSLPLFMKVEHLSGGERQRLAIALAYLKNPALLILDEPTSNLDQENAIIILKLLQKIAQQTKTMILMTTHSSLALEYCDVVYKIEHCKLVCHQQCESIETSKKVKFKPIRLKYYFNYIFKYMKYYYSMYTLIMLVATLGISLVVFSKSYLSTYQEVQKSIFNTNANLEIFIVNKQQGNNPMYNALLPDFTQEQLQALSLLEHVEVYQYGEIVLKQIQIGKETIEGIFLIQPDFRNSSLNGANLDYQLKPYAKEGTLQFVYNHQEISLEINEVLSPIEANSYSYTTGMIIKVPYETFISLNALSQNSMILMCDGLENMQEVINNIQTILPDCGMRYNQIQLKLFTETIDLLKTTSTYLSIIMMIIVLGILIFIYKKIISNRNDELSLLKANGFSSDNVFKLLTIEAIWLSIQTMLFSLIIMIIMQFVCLQLFKTTASVDIIHYMLVVFGLSMLSISLSIYITSYKLIKKSPSQMFKETESSI